MVYNNIIKPIFIITITCFIYSQPIVALSEEKILDDSKPIDWEHPQVFFYSSGYSDDLRINNYSSLRTCFLKDVKLYIYYSMPIWPLFPNFKIWNNSGMITDFNIDFCSLYATNFTGLIIHRISLLGNFWHIIGYCEYFKIRTGYN
jgi:hypothetical protein